MGIMLFHWIKIADHWQHLSQNGADICMIDCLKDFLALAIYTPVGMMKSSRKLIATSDDVFMTHYYMITASKKNFFIHGTI